MSNPTEQTSKKRKNSNDGCNNTIKRSSSLTEILNNNKTINQTDFHNTFSFTVNNTQKAANPQTPSNLKSSHKEMDLIPKILNFSSVLTIDGYMAVLSKIGIKGQITLKCDLCDHEETGFFSTIYSHLKKHRLWEHDVCICPNGNCINCKK